MQSWWVLPAAFLFALAAWVILYYNRFIGLRNQQIEGWSGIEVQLKRRHDLIPRLVETVRGYSGHEQTTLRKVTEARSYACSHLTPSESPEAESRLSGDLAQVLMLAEDYPDLKANTTFQQLMEQLVEVENQIQYARRFYNGAVRDFRNQTQMFPGNLVAGLFKFEALPFFELSTPTEGINPEIRL